MQSRDDDTLPQVEIPKYPGKAIPFPERPEPEKPKLTTKQTLEKWAWLVPLIVGIAHILMQKH